MTRESGLNYLNSLMDWKGTHGFALNKVSSVLKAAGNPQDKVKSVHIAGTNGKGSVSVAVASILGAAGYRVGLNTSPHLTVVNERIVINGSPVSDDMLGDYATSLRNISTNIGVELSLFEAMTAIAFMIFADADLDWIVIEVGLGGRLDATNILKRPEVCSIVTIDFDHEEYLGASLVSIAKEKACIIKPGSKVVIGNVGKDVLDVIKEHARGVHVPQSCFGVDFDCKSLGGSRFEYSSTHRKEKLNFSTELLGAHQGHNLSLAIEIARHLGVEPDTCIEGISKAFWPGRIEKFSLQQGGLGYLDAAHNAAGISTLIDFIKDQKLAPVDLAFGVLKTKRWREMVESIAPLVRSWSLLEVPSPMALPVHELSEFLSGNGIRHVTYGNNYRKFIYKINTLTHSESVPLFIAGSIYLIGALRPHLIPETRHLWQRRCVTC